MTNRTLEASWWVPRGIEEVFAYFGDSQNLDKLTPPWLHLRILTAPPVRMRQGTLIDYRLRLYHIPVRWRTEITVWKPPRRFVDVQLRGPYRRWLHEHTFHEEDGGTRIRDRVEYAVPGGFLEPLVHRFLVGPDLKRIFDYRRQKLIEMYGGRS